MRTSTTFLINTSKLVSEENFVLDLENSWSWELELIQLTSPALTELHFAWMLQGQAKEMCHCGYYKDAVEYIFHYII